jgi:uncharacterized SAM-binding protein YcdF (DUF218 family)
MTLRKIAAWIGASLLLVFALLCLCILGAGRFLEAPAQPPVKADLIFALGGDNGGRVNGVLDLYRRGFAPKVMVGAEGLNPKTRTAYLSWQAQYMVDGGIPKTALLFDRQSKNSWEEARNTLQLMQSMNLQRVLVVSDPPHMRRLSWVWGRVFEGSGKEFTLVACDMEGWDAGRWWGTSPNAQFVFGEYIKLAYYFYQY